MGVLKPRHFPIGADLCEAFTLQVLVRSRKLLLEKAVATGLAEHSESRWKRCSTRNPRLQVLVKTVPRPAGSRIYVHLKSRLFFKHMITSFDGFAVPSV